MFILFLLLSGKISLWYGGALRRAVARAVARAQSFCCRVIGYQGGLLY
jgi:hypothetical protein